MNELKWYFLAVSVIFGGAMLAAVVSDYSKNQCKIEYAKTTRTVEEIAQVCGR